MTVPEWTEQPLFDPGPASPVDILTRALDRPVWSENKADLIARYLRYFVFITKHGTYIDPFAGPQTEKSGQAWTAERVLANEPPWLRRFFLIDTDATQVDRLRTLKGRYADRDITISQGDANHIVPIVIPPGSIKEREATFCLLDQRTFECEWQLCRYIADLRPGPRKVEQFYFFANGWLPRALAGIKTDEGMAQVRRWLGDDDDFDRFRGITSSLDRACHFVAKFRDELGYRSVKPWPIFAKEEGRGAIMYYMIHATDHDEASKLMERAYRKAVAPPETGDQLSLLLQEVSLD
jgi:three-Cys-motif partner protein